MLVQGGIITRDWFSDKLLKEETMSLKTTLHKLLNDKPVEGIKHLNGNQDWESHCHGMGIMEDLAVDSCESFILRSQTL